MTDRRSFLKQTAALTASTMGLLAAGSHLQNPSPTPPAPEEKSLEKYDATVPDTLDLAERCRLALHGVAGQSDPDVYGQMWFTAIYAARRPYLSHGGADGTCTPKFAECFPLLRFASGSEEFRDIEALQMKNLLDNIAKEDGLYYTVWKADRPWHSDYMGHDQKPEDYAQVVGVARMMRAMMAWQDRDGGAQWDNVLQKMARGLGKIAIYKDDYAYYPNGGHSLQFAFPKSGWLDTREPQSEQESKEGSVLDSIGRPVDALARWYKRSGDKEALELAGKIARFIMKEKMWGGLVEDISIDGSEIGHYYSHMHGHLATLRGLLEYGHAAQDARVMEFVRRSYEGSRRYMIPRIGWQGSNGVGESGHAMEACSLGDLVALGIHLSDYGLGDYWEDVDQITRNMLAEQQLTSLERLKAISKSAGGGGPGSPQPKRESAEGMPDRILGIFASFSLPNRLPASSVMGCCTANATQGLYFAWEGALRCSGKNATVNLLVNRASPLVDVDSHIPYTGRVTMRNKAARRISVRILSWIDRQQLRLTVNGQQRSPEWVGNYLTIDDLDGSERIELEFPIPESRATYTAHKRVWRKEQDYTFTFLGSTCIDVEPKTKDPMEIPIFEGSHYRKGLAPTRKVARLVSRREPLEW